MNRNVKMVLQNKALFLLLSLVCYIQTVLAGVLINELNADSPSAIDTLEFIELYNNGISPVPLDDYIIVLYDGSTNTAYSVIPLHGGQISPHGYYVIGSNIIVPQPDKVLDSSINILQNGVDAVALYHGDSNQYTLGMSVTNESLVDAVVYDKRGRAGGYLLDVLTPNEETLDEWSRHLRGEDESLSRCKGMDPLKLSQFQLTRLTPGALNNCTTLVESTTAFPQFPSLPSFSPDIANIYPDIVINEFSVDSISGQFIELYDGGIGRIALDGLIVVTFKGRTEASYGNPILLTGLVTDENGYFLIGQASLEPNIELPRNLQSNRPPNAIALYFENANNLDRFTPVTGVNLVDAVVYGDTPYPEDNALVSVLSAGRLPLIQPTNRVNTSLSRCRSYERLRLDAFTSGSLTPGRDNICSLPDFVINEVNVATHDEPTHQFIEIFDGGLGQQTLDGIVVVLYNGKKSESYRTIDLTDYSTDTKGFCVVGWINGTNVDVPVEFDPTVGFLLPGPGAVALHLSPAERFWDGSIATSYNLVDAVVYGEEPGLELLHALMPYQHVLNELGGRTSSGDRSISRCSCCQRLNSSSFGVGAATPGAINGDCRQNNVTHVETLDHYIGLIRINEIRIAKPGLPRGDFVEIYDGGFGGSGISLDNIVLVLYSSQGESSYKAVDLNGYHTDANGFFVIGPQSVQPTPALIDDNHWFQGETGAVALHKGSSADFPIGTRASSTNLLDAVVYGDNNLLLLDLLSPGQSQVNYTVSTGEKSILRCYSRDAFDIIAYSINVSSPGATNVCPPPPIFINEVNILDSSQAVGQYVELSSNGIPGFPLHDMLLIFWKMKSGNPTSYRTIAINGKRTDNNGLFLIGYRGLSSPHPDMTPFNTPNGKIKEGSNAITLHHGLSKEDYPKKSPPTTDGLVDAIVHGTDDSETAQVLIDFFQPHTLLQINEDSSWSERDESINRCLDSDNNTVYQLAHITPKAHNHCPSRSDASLIINELNLVPSGQFIELWDLGAGFTSLDDFIVVLFGEGDVSYWSIPLTGFSTDSMGYFVMGSISVIPKAHFQFAHGFMRHTYGAVALYRVSSSTSFPDGGPPSSQGLIDAIVYTNMDDNPSDLTNVLTPSIHAIDSRTLQTSGFSLSRCLSRTLRSHRPFASQPQTPKSLNDCPVYSSDVVISEVNVEHPGNSRQKEFIELYDGGVGNVTLQYLSLVLFNSHNADRSYITLDLHGKRTDMNGYWSTPQRRSNGGFLQAGPDAIALYRAPGGAFPYGTEATSRSLVDAIVYSTEERDHVSLVDKLIPGHSVVLEDVSQATGDKTINRCYGNQRLNPDVYDTGLPTPGQANNCSKERDVMYQDILINEVNVEASAGGGEFIELSDKGTGSSPLTGFLLVLFNGANQDRSYLELDLTGYRTNLEGFFVVGTSIVNPAPDIIVHDNFLQNGPDAVVLYHSQARLFPRGTIATSLSMVDVLVYSTDSARDDDSTLVEKLVPGQRSASEYAAYLDGDESLSRCLSNNSRSLSAFTLSQPTPGHPNTCIGTPVVINEVKLAGNTSGFIELYDGGRGSTPLDSLSLVLYDSSDNGLRAYSAQTLLGKSTNRNGYFVYGKPSSEWSVDLEVSSSLNDFPHSDGSSAVALYKDEVKGSFTDNSVLIDAMVYGSRNPLNTDVINFLISGQSQVQISPDFSRGDVSISRCSCCAPLVSAAFEQTRPTPRQENHCMTGTTVAMPTNVIINEVSPWTGGTEYSEYIELRGPPGARLDALTLVLSSSTKNGPAYYFALSLAQRTIASDGIFLIGSGSVTPPPNAILPQSLGAVIRPGEGAVAIYRRSHNQFREGAPVTSVDLVDAVVYTNISSQTSTQLSSILTPGSDSIFTGNLSAVANIATPSVSRCDCCDSPDPSAFTLSAQTPGQTNQCPSRTYKRTIQMHILDAAYEVWVTNSWFTRDLGGQIAAGVNAECKCGFNDNYLKDEKLLNGSVFYQAEMFALSPSHSKLLYDSYISYVSKTGTVKVLGTDYHIDNKCFTNCLSGGNDSSKPGRQTGQGGSAAVPVAVVITVVVIVAVIAVMIFVFLRHRRGSLSFGKIERDGAFRVTNRRTLGDLDVLGTVTDTRSPTEFFSNPVYMYEPPKAPIPQPGPPVKAGPQQDKDRLKAEEGSSQAKVDSARASAVSNGVHS